MARGSELMRGSPPGVSLIRSLRGKDWSFSSYRYAVLLITFIAYTCYHASRKPISIVKSVLYPEQETIVVSNPWPFGSVFIKEELLGNDKSRAKNKGWAPFDGEDGPSKLGLFQATGWPSVVAVIGNWFGKRKRGLIMGIWNAHTSVGNITGSLLAASVLQYGWGWSFIVPGAFIFLGGVLVYLFLPAYPEDVGFPCPYSLGNNQQTDPGDLEVQNQSNTGPQVSSINRRSVGLFEACLIPGVIPFALCLFFSKLVAYTFLYWLPFYLSQTEIGGAYMSVKSAGNLSTLFDVGGIVGGIIAGYLSDKLNARATTAATFMYAAIPSMLLYRFYGGASMTWNIVLMMIVGLFVNGPYALITTAVSADLGTHSSLKGDLRALATVTAIIDGTGSAGAALGPLLTGFLSTKGWDKVFLMLMIGALIAGLLLSRLVVTEIADMLKRKRSASTQCFGGSTSQPLLTDDQT